MIQRALGKTGYSVFPVAYGGIVSMKDGQSESDKYVSWAIDRGVNYFDVAPSYQDAEEKLGNSLKPYRKNVYLACKTAERMAKDAEREMLNSLNTLYTDYFDVYQLHGLASVEEVDMAFGPGGAMELLVKMKEKGIARKIGITCHSEEAALKAISLYPFDTVLFPLNWHMHMGHDMGKQLMKTAKSLDMGVLSMKQLVERAWLDGESREEFPKSWCKPFSKDETALRIAAMKYVLSIGADILIPPGNFECFSFEVENVENCIKNPLTEEETALLKAHLEKVSAHPFF
ncbi:MAG: aldo/keto reductase [Clostridia bacterium]|nr:aldo/keto reductase [Clostridia bacterium]